MTRRSLSDRVAPAVPRTARFFAGVPAGAASRRRPAGLAGAAPAEPDFVCFSALLREVLADARVQGDGLVSRGPVES